MSVVAASKIDLIREAAESSLENFIRLVQPGRVLGSVHCELISWLTREDRKKFQLVLMPRDHMKSAIAGLYAAWSIVRNPAIRILYLSSTSNLASKQLKFIKDILNILIFPFILQQFKDVVIGHVPALFRACHEFLDHGSPLLIACARGLQRRRATSNG